MYCEQRYTKRFILSSTQQVRKDFSQKSYSFKCANAMYCFNLLTRYSGYSYGYSSKTLQNQPPPVFHLFSTFSSWYHPIFCEGFFFLAGRVTRFRGLQILWIFLWWLGIVGGWCGYPWLATNISVRGSAQWVPRGMGTGRLKHSCRINYGNKYWINLQIRFKSLNARRKLYSASSMKGRIIHFHLEEVWGFTVKMVPAQVTHQNFSHQIYLIKQSVQRKTAEERLV